MSSTKNMGVVSKTKVRSSYGSIISASFQFRIFQGSKLQTPRDESDFAKTTAGQLDDIQGVFDDGLGLKDAIEDTLKVFLILCSCVAVFTVIANHFCIRIKLKLEIMKS